MPPRPPHYPLSACRPPAAPLDHAVALARETVTDGLLAWSERSDRLQCALVLEPDAPLADSLLVVYVAMLALADALGALAPPMVTVSFGWPNRIEVNGGIVGVVELRAAPVDHPEAVPPWLIAAIDIAIARDAEDVAREDDVAQTSLREEGCGDAGAEALLEAFARHLLPWMREWQEDGFAPIREAWLGRAVFLAEGRPVVLPDGTEGGLFRGIDDRGGLLQERQGEVRAVPLEQALAASASPR